MAAAPSVKTILILAGNSNGMSQHSLADEVSEIDDGLRSASKRDRFKLEEKWAVQPLDIQRALTEIEPQIVHFSGQGNAKQGLIFESEKGKGQAVVHEQALADLFELFAESVECVVLNGCYSQSQAEAIAQHIPYVIGTTLTPSNEADAQSEEDVTDGESTVIFAVGFYDAIGAGQPIERAYKLASVALKLEGLADRLTPFLVKGPERPSESPPDDLLTEEGKDKPEQDPLDADPEEDTPEDIYLTLLRLGYHKQSREFRRLMQTHAMASLLICGAPDYGQRWLLNRLVVQYVPNLLSGKKIVIDIGRKVRRSDLSALWRELAGRLGLKGKPYTPAEVAQQVSQCLQTQDVLIVFHEVESVPDEVFAEIIESFWQPLVGYVQEISAEKAHKLLLFLIDYDGCVGSGSFPFAKRLSKGWTPQKPLKATELAKFSEDDLMSWMDNQYDKLPPVLAESNVDDEVVEILAGSDEGVPEKALEMICDRCGYDWYEAVDKWLKL